MRNASTITEADILAEIIAPNRPGFGPELAQSILALKFSKSATTKIRGLLRKTNRGTVSAAERLALEKYLRVGQFLDLLQAKARVSLRRAANGS